MHFSEERMPSTEKNTKNEVCHESARTVPNGNTWKTGGEVREDSRNDAEYCNCDTEPNSKKPRSDSNWRQIKDKERILETGNVVKPANQSHQKQTSDYN